MLRLSLAMIVFLFFFLFFLLFIVVVAVLYKLSFVLRSLSWQWSQHSWKGRFFLRDGSSEPMALKSWPHGQVLLWELRRLFPLAGFMTLGCMQSDACKLTVQHQRCSFGFMKAKAATCTDETFPGSGETVVAGLQRVSQNKDTIPSHEGVQHCEGSGRPLA